MAALLKVEVLRQHALPAAFMIDHDRAALPVAAGLSPAGALACPRPRLAAAWSLGDDGCLVCGWVASAPDTHGRPPD